MTVLPHGALAPGRLPPRNRKFTEQIIANFQSDVVASLGCGGWDEERLREPVRTLFRSMGALLGIPVTLRAEGDPVPPGERPDFGVDLSGFSRGPVNRIGHVELQPPGSPIPPDGLSAEHDRERWEEFRELPNILYTNGSEWALFRHGAQWRRTVAFPIFLDRPQQRIPGADFERLLREFLSWRPPAERASDRPLPRIVLAEWAHGTGPAPAEGAAAGGPARPRTPVTAVRDGGTPAPGRPTAAVPSPRSGPKGADWRSLPTVDDLLPWRQPGVAARRAWVCAPEERTLRHRWQRLLSAPPGQRNLLLRTAGERGADAAPPRSGAPERLPDSPAVSPVLHRAFDRRYLLTEEHCLDRPRPHLWQVSGPRQVYVVEQHAHPFTSGPGLLFGSLVPDADCFNGRGGRVLPLYRDPEGTIPNLTPGLLPYLADRLGVPVPPEDLVAYLAAVVAHPGYTAAFRDRLAVSGIRVPLTGDPRLWREAVALGREVVWLHTFGQRCADPAAGRPAGPPRLPEGERPEMAVAVPASPAAFPDRIRHDSDTAAGGHRLHVGGGVIARVRPEVWRYDVGGVRVVRGWFAARRRIPRGGRTSPLDGVRPDRWSPRRTEDLLELLTVLTRLVRLEPRQADLLHRVRGGPLVTVADLTGAGVLPVAPGARRPPPLGGQLELPLD